MRGAKGQGGCAAQAQADVVDTLDAAVDEINADIENSSGCGFE